MLRRKTTNGILIWKYSLLAAAQFWVHNASMITPDYETLLRFEGSVCCCRLALSLQFQMRMKFYAATDARLVDKFCMQYMNCMCTLNIVTGILA
jgi:hypothetical protein